jgi:hypothetical protein
MFIAVLFIIAHFGNRLDVPQLMNWRKCDTHTHTHTQNGVYSAIKKNEIMLFVGKWMELENIMLSNVCQA